MASFLFFNGGEVVTYDHGVDQVVTRQDIATRFPGSQGQDFHHNIDAALNIENGFLYLFKGSDYMRFDLARDKFDLLRVPIGREWNGLADARLPDGSSFADRVDAAVNWGNGKVYFFRRNRYVRYDLATDAVDVQATPIGREWNGFTEAKCADGSTFADGVDAAVNWGSGKAYFFRGSHYLRYDIFNDRVDHGWPKLIGADHVTGVENWTGMTGAGFHRRVRGAVGLFTGQDTFLAGVETVLPAPTVERPPFLNVQWRGDDGKQPPLTVGTPWRGVLHITDPNPGIDVVVNGFRASNFWPHFTISPQEGRIIQHYSLHHGSRSLIGSAKAGVLTNQTRAIQIEICATLAQVRAFGAAENDFIRDVMMRIEAEVPIPRRSGLRFLDVNAGGALNSLSKTAWLRFSGWCGHQHTPSANKPCPGPLNIGHLVAPNT